MLRKALTALVGLVILFAVSMILARVLNLGPEEFWLVPAGLLVLAGIAVVLIRRRSPQD